MEAYHRQYPAQSERRTVAASDIVQFPALPVAGTSLTAAEKLLLGYFIRSISPTVILELGIWQGLTVEFICEFLALNQIDACVVGFDIPSVIAAARRAHPAMDEWERIGRLQLVPGYLPWSLRAWLVHHPAPIDLALIDADHRYESVLSELQTLWPQLAREGLILCHDYHWTKDPGLHGSMAGVAYAVDGFARRTRGAQVLSLRSSRKTQRTLDWQYNSVLVGLRHRPYQPQLWRVVLYALRDVLWRRRGSPYRSH